MGANCCDYRQAPTAWAGQCQPLPAGMVHADFQYLSGSFQGPFWASLPQNDLNCYFLLPGGHHLLHEFFYSFVVSKTGREI